MHWHLGSVHGGCWMTVLRALRIKGGWDVGMTQPLMLSDMKFVSVLREGVKPIWQMYDCLILLLTLLATALCQDGREGRKGRREEERHEGKRWKDIGTRLTYSLKRCISKTKPQHLVNLCGGNLAKYTYIPSDVQFHFGNFHALGEPGRCWWPCGGAKRPVGFGNNCATANVYVQ